MKPKKLILKYFIISMIMITSVGGVLQSKEARAVGTSVLTSDALEIKSTLADTAKSLGAWAKDWAKDAAAWLRDEGIALAYKKALSYFLQQLAHDTAVYLATGDKGQSPMFYTESWGDYLKNVGDNAVGEFLEELGEGGTTKFNLCDPGLDVTMKIGYGIMQSKNPNKPDCSFTEMKNNWQAELQRSDFLNRFGNMFEPSSNDFGIALSLQGKVMDKEVEAIKKSTLKRSVNKGMKDVTDKISEAIKTPADIVRSYTDATFDKKDSQYLNYTGHALADAIETFTSTLSSTLMKELLKKGLARSSDDTSYTGNWGGYSSGGGAYSGSSNNGGSSISGSSYSGGGGLTTYQADAGGSSGISAAKEQFEAIVEPSFAVKGDYEALNELVTCSNPTHAKTNECVMTENFRQAIENRMTVAEAVTKKYINKDGVFGFRADGLEPNFNEGIPYRSMIIMRKYRIIPVGWELAAQYIKDHQDDLHRSLSLYDMIACFYVDDPANPTDALDRYPGYDEDWCRGLVDPSWVLKAPQNFCKREGPGPYILSSHVSGEKEKSKLYVARDDTYCADEQTCIKEDDDGSCELYGYCTEDRRKYNFGGESCDPIYNTCQSFRAQDGRTISLLKNTLDYGTSDTPCTAENAGCQHFVQATNPFEEGDGSFYNSPSDEINWAQLGDSINLDNSAVKCDKENEGCHEFIRTKSGLGANLLINPSFEEYTGGAFAGWTGAGTQERDYVRDGSSAIQITSGATTSQSITIDPFDISKQPRGSTGNFDLAGNTFTLSAYARDCLAGNIEITAGGETADASLEASDWRLVTVTHTFGLNVATDTLAVNIAGDNCIIDAVKLEITDPGAEGRPTRFTNYREAGLVYQKLIPDYLYSSCYDYDANGDGFIERLANAPKNCDDYVRFCTAKEVNCDLYTSMTDNFSVPASVKAGDYCPAECVGYDEYGQTATDFEDAETEYFIPDTADTCSAVAAGCDEFTNLDELDNPEAREYFVHLRTCINPEDSAANCQPFFMWEGTDETGYQLLVHQLDTLANGTIRRVNITDHDCSTVIGNTNYDADCREFYDANGAVHYELYNNTVSCTDDCHPYRRTATGDVDEQVYCEGGTNSDGNVVLGHGGHWDATNNYCIYMGVPSEGVTCEAEEAGCREYNGNTGANTRIIFEHNFENGTNQGWDNAVVSNTSVIVGEHSLAINSSPASLTLGSELQKGKSYVLQFLAVGIDDGSGNVGDISGIYFDNVGIDTDNPQQIDFDISSMSITDRWGSYEVNLDSLDHTINPANEKLSIKTNGRSVNIDNIRLTEVTDRHYLIEDSWADNCDYENADPSLSEIPEETFAGCDAYTDRDNMPHNLYKFDHLCSDSAVGCELMIDTHNSTNYGEEFWNDLDGDGVDDGTAEPDFTAVPADSYVYAVYDDDKTCNQQDKGCERLGLDYRYEYPSNTNYSQYFDNYKLNNPDMYNKSLCKAEAVSCDAWDSRNGSSYFKDPADMLCEWRVESNLGMGSWNWLRKKVKRCDENSNGIIDTFNILNNTLQSGAILQASEMKLCSDASDCELTAGAPERCDSDEACGSGTCIDNECHNACILDTNDYPCAQDNNYPSYPPKTMGHGGSGAKVRQPLGGLEIDPAISETSNWVAACPSNQDDCSEYIDPESTAAPYVDVLEPYTLYILDNRVNNSVPSQSPGDTICPSVHYYKFDVSTNNLVIPSPLTTIAPGDAFYYVPNLSDNNEYSDECKFVVDSGGQTTHYIKKAIVDYQLANTLDKSSCNGMVDLEQNCILLNERNRAMTGVDGMDKLIYDADPLLYGTPDVPKMKTPENANALLKVTPDRACNAWLSCRSFIKDEAGNDVCYDVGSCERLDANGNCSYFTPSTSSGEAVNQTYDPFTSSNLSAPSALDVSNLTGYSMVGYDVATDPNDNTLKSDYYLIGDMKQVGQVGNVPNGSFELYDDNMYPIGWTVVPANRGNKGGAMDWDRDMFKVINNPVAAQTEGISYPLDGKAFLKFGARDSVQSEPLALATDDNVDYILTFYINTKNLASGEAIVSSELGNFNDVSVGVSQDWKKYMAYIKGPAHNNDRIIFKAIGDGNVFVDKVEIKPTLHSRDVSPDAPWYIAPTCRLYPKSDSLSCDYYEEGGNRVKGLLGYCLEYDRYPGNPDACLMWYPVDRINGDGIEEGGGYIDRKPLYYCVDTTGYDYGTNLFSHPDDSPSETETLVEDNNFNAQSSGDMSITHRNPDGWSEDTWTLDQLGLGSVDKRWLRWENIDHIRIHEMSPSTYCGDKYEEGWDLYFRFDENDLGSDCPRNLPTSRDCQPWGVTCTDIQSGCAYGGLRIISEDGSFSGLETTNWDGDCNHPDYQILEIVIFPKVFYCTDVIQTVTPMGQNQYYSANVYEGSNFGQNGELSCNADISFADTKTCSYMSDLAPFGAVAEPGMWTNDWAIMSNPYMWDSKENIENNQPLFYEIPNGSMFNDSQARMGQEYDKGEVLNSLFHKSYGHWQFHASGTGSGVQQVMGNYFWQKSGAEEGRAGHSPEIGQTVNNPGGNIWTIPDHDNVHVNQLVNLKFTSDVNRQQLPLTMYMVNWGDGSVTSVAGLEMRDRPSADNPHSLYHIYSEPCTSSHGDDCDSTGAYNVKITIRDNWGLQSPDAVFTTINVVD